MKCLTQLCTQSLTSVGTRYLPQAPLNHAQGHPHRPAPLAALPPGQQSSTTSHSQLCRSTLRAGTRHASTQPGLGHLQSGQPLSSKESGEKAGGKYTHQAARAIWQEWDLSPVAQGRK